MSQSITHETLRNILFFKWCLLGLMPSDYLQVFNLADLDLKFFIRKQQNKNLILLYYYKITKSTQTTASSGSIDCITKRENNEWKNK